MRTAIYGAGSLGTILGAYISKAGVAIDLINRKKEEIDVMQHYIDLLKAGIERLQGYNENLQTANVALSNEILKIKAEAIKEFAERLKEKKRFAYAHLGKTHYTVYGDDIDELVQEMVGDEDGTVY